MILFDYLLRGYIAGMTMPTLVVSSVSDEFFLIDDTHYFFDDLPGDKYFW